MRLRKLMVLFLVLGLLLTNCFVITAFAEENPMASTSEGDADSTGLIFTYSLSVSAGTGCIYITASTYGTETMGKIGFQNIEVQRSSNGSSGWITELSPDNDVVKNASVHIKSGEYHPVAGGYYYRVKLDHYAKENGFWFPDSQSITNYSNVVWIPVG